MPAIKPSVGRKLHYWPTFKDVSLMTKAHNDQPCDATVIYVWSDTCVNLQIFDHGGGLHFRESVRVMQSGEELPPHGGYAEWPFLTPPKKG